MISKLLVAYDGSEQSRKAYSMGVDMASRYSAQMIVLSVVQPPEPPVAVELEAVLESATEYYEGHFRCMKEQAAALGIDAEFQVRVGHPAEQIVHLAHTEKVDAIVMRHRGESFLQRWLLGSVAKRVLSYAHCTVVIVR
jgi:nucleotide-binding universal stress UspA family protein